MLGFTSIFLSSALWPNLPKISLLALIILILFLLLRYRSLFLVCGGILGLVWATLAANYYLHWQLPSKYYQQNVIVEGFVDSIVSKQSGDTESSYFNFKASKVGKRELIFTPRIRVSWFKPLKELKQGQQWRLFVKLKRPVGLANKAGFNYQKWLVSQNIVATAYVKASPSNTLINNSVSYRQANIDNLLNYNLPMQKWVLALMYGERSLLEPQDWQLLQNTGTAHLFAISGMHLGIVFSVMLLVNKGLFLARATMLSHCGIQINRKPLHFILSLGVCIIYAYFAGFQIPVLRALIGLAVIALLILMGLFWRWQASILSLLSIFILLFPFAPLGMSFWFSFIAVCLIWFFMWRWPLNNRSNKVSTVWRVFAYGFALQVFLSISTIPMTALAFDSIPYISLFANIFAIPIVSLILVPLCLLCAALIAFGFQVHGILLLIDGIFEFTVDVLSQFQRYEALDTASYAINSVIIMLGALLALLVLLPNTKARVPLIASSILTLFTFVILNNEKPKQGQWQLSVFDVGQGSAMVIQSNNAYLVYDTGPSFKGSFSMAEAVLMPYFKSKGYPPIDKLVLSHLDNDHAGGRQILLNNLSIKDVISPLDVCNAGNNFIWQGLSFTILWPLKSVSGEENSHSCVIKIDDGHHSVLLSGDIEKPTEQAMLAKYTKNELNASVLLAPHHGSISSSTAPFVAAVEPEYVVFTSGFANRWGFPHSLVLKRYTNVGAYKATTGTDGQITFNFSPKGINMSRYRTDEFKRWYFKAPSEASNKM
ncbi:DNA internalization-related competence protein ComEC/Rec2 [Glaciecola sp. 2405UD65-10]|uniref:DNA internalization-related competence protein ComEC/Rec2 n=1 Tax=Glaciecola sp. 2405UD65-10 TaxID=3397244 RepID=UPI003B58D9FF